MVVSDRFHAEEAMGEPNQVEAVYRPFAQQRLTLSLRVL